MGEEIVGGFDTSGVTHAGGNNQGAFQNCKVLPTIPTLDFSKCQYLTRIFSGCLELKEANIINMNAMKEGNDGYTNGGIFGDGCGITTFKTLDLSNLDSTIDHLRYPIFVGNNLQNLEMKGIITESVKICDNSGSLTTQSILNVLNALATVSDTKQLIIGSANLAKLTDEQIAIATNKGWTVN